MEAKPAGYQPEKSILIPNNPPKYPGGQISLPSGGEITVNIKRTDEVYIHDELLKIGKLAITEDINSEVFSQFRKDLIWCCTKAPNLKQIEVEICSPGGQVFYGFAFFDLIRRAMREYRVLINTVGEGFMASMGSIIFQAGHRRLATENSWYMIHEIKSLRWGDESTSAIVDEGKLLERIQKERMWKIYQERSTFTEDDMEHWTRKEWWMDAGEMLKNGLCDEVIDCSLPNLEAE